MINRRAVVLTLSAGIAAMVLVVAPVIADELLGVLTKVDVEGKKVTVVEKGTEKEVEVTITDATEYATKKGPIKVDLERVSKQLEKAKEKGRKGIEVAVTHEKGVASKIAPRRKGVPKAEN